MRKNEKYIKKHCLITAAVLGLFSLQGGQVLAQDSEQFPAAIDPARLEQDFRPFKVPSVPLDLNVPGQQNVVVPEGFEDISFVLKEMALNGNNIIGTEELAEIYKQDLGQLVSLADIYNTADKITAYYRNKGYVLSQAVVPQQEIDGNGIVAIEVVEGYISEISFTSDLGARESRIRSYVERILESRPLKAKDLERHLLILNDLPGYQATATLSPSDKVGAAKMDISVVRDKFSHSYKLDNRGNKFIGPQLMAINGQINDLSSLSNSLGLTVVSSLNSELNFGILEHILPVGSQGLRFSQELSVSNSQPGDILENLEIDSTSTRVGLALSYPIVRSRKQNLYVQGALSSIDIETSRGLEGTESEDSIRSVRLGIDYELADKFNGVNRVSAEVSKGLDILSARTEAGTGEDLEYTKTVLSISRLQYLTPSLSLFVDIVSQFSDDKLVSVEQFGVGGQRIGSAFDASEIVGDNGYGGRLEFRYSHPSRNRWFLGMESYIFADGGEVESNDGGIGSDSKESLSSSGIGIRFKTIKNITGYVEYAIPTSNEVSSEGNDNGRVFISVQKQF